MATISTTLVPDEGRGCGDRVEEGVYGCLGLNVLGGPVWDFLVDPPIPYPDPLFRGVQFAPPEMVAGWDEDAVLLLDWVGKEHYPSVPSFVEEVRRFGLSRRFQPNFDFAALAGKRPYLGLIHARAAHGWPAPSVGGVPYEGTLSVSHNERPAPSVGGVPLPRFDFRYCRKRLDADAPDHYPECVFHLWPLATRLHKEATRFGLVEMPGFIFDAFHVAQLDGQPIEDPAWQMAQRYSDGAGHAPGIFAVFEISHFEVIGAAPEGTSLVGAALPVVLMEK